MIAAALQLINSARSLWAKSWLVAIAIVAIVVAAARLVTYGEHREAVRIATIARADTLRGDLATLRVAQTAQSTALAQLTLARPATIATGVARAKARSAVVIPAAIPSEASNLHLAVVDSLPAAIITLLNADDAKITADSIYIAAAESLTSTIPKLEAARAALDTVLLHQIQPSPDASFWLPASRTIKVGGALLISYAVWSLWHQHSPSP
jgi:hypothetical protein